MENLKILKNKNGRGKVMDYGKLAKSHSILYSVIEYFQFCPYILANFSPIADIKNFSISLESLHFSTFSAQCRECEI